MTLMKMKNMMVMMLTRMTMIKYDKNEMNRKMFLNLKIAKNNFNLNIKYTTTHDSRYEYSNHNID
jgi:hypothetical protein